MVAAPPMQSLAHSGRQTMFYQTIPVIEYRIWCTTDRDLNYEELVNYKKARELLNELRKDYPRDEFKLIAIVDA
jgi:hypothetical protein